MRHSRPAALLATAAALLAAAPRPAAAQPSAPRSQSAGGRGDALRARLDSAVPALMRAGEIAGISAAVVRDGALHWSGAYGVRNSTSGEPVDRSTVFDAASLTKPVVAYAVLRLADRGVLRLDEPIAGILPNDRMKHDERYARITPRMV